MKNKFMFAALEEAKHAFEQDEVPVGCVITFNNEIIARSHNLRETQRNTLCHAEILAIDKACNELHDWRLNECDIYVTLEPCVMCAGAILNARFKRLYFGSYDIEYGGVYCLENAIRDKKTNIEIYGGICEEECKTILEVFFNKIRKR